MIAKHGVRLLYLAAECGAGHGDGDTVRLLAGRMHSTVTDEGVPIVIATNA